MRFNLMEFTISKREEKILVAAGEKIPEDSDKQTVLSYLSIALLNAHPDDRTDADTKMKRFNLLLKMGDVTKDNPVLDLTHEEISVINSVLDKFAQTLVLGRFRHFFNNPLPAPPEPPEDSSTRAR